MKKLLSLLFLLLFGIAPIRAQIDFNDNCRKAYADIIALRFEDARNRLADERDTNPDNMLIPYLENYMDFLTVFIGEDEEEFEFLEENKDSRIDRMKKMADTSRYKRYMLGNVHLQWAVARLKFKEYITAALEINRAYRLLEKNAGTFPGFIPNNVSLGVLHIMIGMVPDKYRWMLDLISMEGSVEEGRTELYQVLAMSKDQEAHRYLYEETLFYLGFVEMNILPDPETLSRLHAELEPAGQGNLLLAYLDINILMRTGRNDSALEKFSSLTRDAPGYLPFHYLDYLEGECHLRNLDTPKATVHLDRFLQHFRGRNYIKDAFRKKAWACLLEGDTAGYRRELSHLRDAGNEDVDIDREAQREAESGTLPDAGLIRARLLFDGGYYLRTDSVLKNMSTVGLNPEENVEWLYRGARVAHASGRIEASKELYIKTIDEGSGLKRYFAGNSALKLGEIYEQEQDPATALFYYRLCLDLDFREYESSIHSKARAGIDRLTE